MLTNFKAPYKVNKRVYISLIAIMIIVLAVSIVISCHCSSAFVETISEIVKNLAYGCIASTFVAWLIDRINVREKMKRHGKFIPQFLRI